MRPRTILSIAALTLLVTAALAGCIEADPDLDSSSVDDAASNVTLPMPPADADFAHLLVNDHDHQDPSLHTAHAGLALAGFDDLTEGLRAPVEYAGYSEVDVHGDLAVVASVEGNRAFTLVDLSDPKDPEVLSHFYSWGENWDARFSESGDLVFIGCQGGTPGGAFTQATGVGACISPNGFVPESTEDNAIMAVDVSDPEDPTLAGWTPSGSIHNLETWTLDDGTILVADSPGELFTYDPDEGAFEQVASFDARHDVTFAEHPETGTPYMFTGTQDLTIYDVSQPTQPELVGALDPETTPDGVTAWHEQSPAPAMIDGRWILVGAGEDSAGLPGEVGVFDITDPTDIEVLGTWKLPGEYTEQGSYKFSNHNIHVNAQGQAAIGMYHGGVWVFDVSTEDRMHDPVTLAAYQPHEDRLAPPQVTPYGNFVDVPYVWTAQWAPSGHLLVPDINTGLYVLEPSWEQAPLDESVGNGTDDGMTR